MIDMGDDGDIVDRLAHRRKFPLFGSAGDGRGAVQECEKGSQPHSAADFILAGGVFWSRSGRFQRRIDWRVLSMND
jgi:hypothetical protein